jgi:hypothetical protein
VIGNVYVTDADDHDSGDKTFEVDPMTAADAEEQFQVNKETGNITMKAGTKAGTYTLFVRVRSLMSLSVSIYIKLMWIIL